MDRYDGRRGKRPDWLEAADGRAKDKIPRIVGAPTVGGLEY